MREMIDKVQYSLYSLFRYLFHGYGDMSVRITRGHHYSITTPAQNDPVSFVVQLVLILQMYSRTQYINSGLEKQFAVFGYMHGILDEARNNV